MLISKTVDVKVNSYTVKYYEELGYQIPRKENGKYDTKSTITVNVNDLPKTSNYYVDYTCDYCGELITQPYKVYNQEIHGIIPKNSCLKCKSIKTGESNLIKYGKRNVFELDSIKEKSTNTINKKYGVDNVSQSQEIKDKKKQTNIKHWGTENVFQCEEIKEKSKETLLNKYGVTHNMSSDIFKQKTKQTLRKRYGINNIMDNEEFRQKAINTNIQRYGHPYVMQNKDILRKARESFSKNQTTNTSRQQRYIATLYNLELNYPIKYYNVDVCDVKNKIAIEVDCGGHWLSVKLGNMTLEEFNHKQLIREEVMKREQYKLIRIISKTDKLPSDEILLQMLEDAKQYFSDYPEHSWIYFDIDNENIRNAENKDGVPYFYGQLRYIKKQQLESA